MSVWSYSAITTLVTSTGTFTYNASSGDTILIDPNASTGLGTSAVRTAIFNKGQADGYNILPGLEEGQHLALSGMVVIRSASDEAGYVTARDTLLTSHRTVCRGAIGAAGTLTIGTDSLSVYCEHLPEVTGGFVKSVIWGLVSPTAA